VSIIVADATIIGTRYADNSGLRARLSGRKPDERSVETELRSFMLEREQTSRRRRARKRKR
jgi:hypothetical protein